MALDLKQVPNTPGIYKFFSKNKIIYIGKAKNLRKGVGQFLFQFQHYGMEFLERNWGI